MTGGKNWMPIYIGDYLGDTQRLTTEQHGAYLLLMFDYWRSGPPPDDDTILQRITLLDRAAWKRHRPAIERFFEVRDGQWFHKRIERERAEANQKAGKAAAKAKAAANARWGDRSTSDGMPDAMLGALPEELHEQCPPPPPPPTEEPSGSSGRKSRKTKLPEGWEPTLTPKAQAMVALWPAGKFEREVEKFIDHAASNGRTALDWQAAFRTWINNADEWMNSNGRRNQGSFDTRDGLTRAIDSKLHARHASGSS